MSWPYSPIFANLTEGTKVTIEDQDYFLKFHDAGILHLPSGKLTACDPFTMLSSLNPYFVVPSGSYQVMVTVADVSGKNDGSHFREAYVTLVLREAEITKISPIAARKGDGSLIEEWTIGVDSGTVCMTDLESIQKCMPNVKDDDWYENYFDGGDNSWFSQMDDPQSIAAGIANIVYPLGKNGENIIIVHSGWGDGVYPLMAGYNSSGDLCQAYIDLAVIGDFTE